MESSDITHQIKLKGSDTLFWLGDRFYKVEQCILPLSKILNNRGSVEYQSKCPSCNDTRKIKYVGCDNKEYEADCPICKGSIYKGWGNTIKLINWKVHEYIVHKISAQGPEVVSAYNDGAGYIDSLSLSAFCKFGRCMDEYIETHIPSLPNNVDVDVESLDMAAVEQYGRNKDYVFRNKKDAEKLCQYLKEYDRERLEEFNKTYGTDYKYPF